MHQIPQQTISRSSIKEISVEAKKLIKDFEEKLYERLKAAKIADSYTSIDDILSSKYQVTDFEKIPGLENKTEFITKGVRGNVSKAEGKILTYKEADELIEKATNEELP